MRDSFVFYRGYRDMINEVPEEHRLNALLAILDYALDDKEPDGDWISRMAVQGAKAQIDKNNQRYCNGLKGGRPPVLQDGYNQTGFSDNQNKPSDNQSKPNDNQNKPSHNQTKPNDNQNKPSHNQTEPNDNDNDNVNVNDNDKEKEIKRKRFAPPTTQEVKAYCAEKGYSVDAERFVDFYASKGWMIGKNAMKDWRSAVRNWSRSQRQELTTKAPGMNPGNRFNNFDQRTYDYKDLERKLLAGGGGNSE